MSGPGIVRAARSKGHWVAIPNAALRDARLSWRARGLLARLLSNSDGFTMTATDLAAEGKEGREAVLAALRELREAGYLVTQRHQVSRGRWVTTNVIFDQPVSSGSGPKAALAEVGFPDSGGPDSGGPASGGPDVGGPDAGGPAHKKKSKQSDQQNDQKNPPWGQFPKEIDEAGVCLKKKKCSRQHSAADTPPPAPPVRRAKLKSGLTVWNEDDRQLAAALEAAWGAGAVNQACHVLALQGMDALPSRVEKILAGAGAGAGGVSLPAAGRARGGQDEQW